MFDEFSWATGLFEDEGSILIKKPDGRTKMRAGYILDSDGEILTGIIARSVIERTDFR